jgi:hypothetical protein
MDLDEIRELAGGVLSLGALFAFVLLLPLYLSQRRDVRRLRFWMERDPDHPAGDLAASEQLLDRAEADLEQLIGEAPQAIGATPKIGLPPAERVTSERPALTRITMERAALEPHPTWRRFVARATDPRALVVTGMVAVLVGIAVIIGFTEPFGGDGDGRGSAAAIDPANVTVAVLNGTTVTGLAGKVGSDVESRGFVLGAVTNTDPGSERTEVLYVAGEKRAAQKVAKGIGVGEVAEAQGDVVRLGGDADVIVIAGEDRAQ